MKYINSIYTPDQLGRLGGVVFGKNKYGYFLKVFKSPSNPKSLGQQEVRSFFGEASREWSKLTSAQRRAWNDIAPNISFVKDGNSYTLTGFNLFVKLNRNLQNIGEGFYKNADMISMVTPESMTGASVDIIATPGSEDIKLNLIAPLDASTKAIVYATPVLKESRRIKWNGLRIIGVIDSTFVSGDSIESMYLAKFEKIPEAGETAGFAIMPVNEVCGLTNSKVYVSATGTL